MAKPFNAKNWLISAVRRASLRYPPAIEARNRNKEEYYILSKKGKPMRRVKHICEQCGKKDLKTSEYELDHTVPLVGKEGFIDWNTFFERYLIDASGFKKLCIPCHESKTRAEMGDKYKERRKKKKKSKNT